MNKDELLKLIATSGYNVYFGAKKHFATYDIIEKLPRAIALLGLLIGIWQLWKPDVSYSQLISFLLIVSSVYSYTITQYDGEKENYDRVGQELTQIHNQLHRLYLNVKSSNASVFPDQEAELEGLMASYYRTAISKQILFSNTVAHFKFFGEAQIAWMDEQLNFTFWKDKVPKVYHLILWILVAIVVIFILAYCVYSIWARYTPFGG
ncbi:SLATT domain-containing protein [Paenibacillus xylanexedens]|uniref:SLATT domain-containing protein n=1 Tax=Paenibacillus xylanexedens TaxID=528191 RepID=UPI0011A4DFA5|nr:SLATT domain-containing protein [Paenibacillus xylanexedens]